MQLNNKKIIIKKERKISMSKDMAINEKIHTCIAMGAGEDCKMHRSSESFVLSFL